MKTESFDGRSSEMKTKSPWLSQEDLLGLGDVPVTIKAAFRHRDVEFEAGRKEPEVFSLEFEKAAKQMVINSTNRKVLVKMFGPKVSDWIGKTITLYIDPTVKMMGKVVGGVRIRETTKGTK